MGGNCGEAIGAAEEAVPSETCQDALCVADTAWISQAVAEQSL